MIALLIENMFCVVKMPQAVQIISVQPAVCFLFVHSIRFVCRVTACCFLHAAGESILGGTPVGVLVAVVEFVTEPVQIVGKSLHVLLHHREQNVVEGFLFFVRQSGFRSLHKIPEMRNAKALAVFEKRQKFRIFLKKVEEGVQITGVCIFVKITDITAFFLCLCPGTKGSLCRACVCISTSCDKYFLSSAFMILPPN